jgi:hypothetical protein
MRFEVGAHTMTLSNGRTSFYGKVTIGRRTVWVSRWRSADVPVGTGPSRQVELWRGPVMLWYAGVRVLGGVA